MDLPENRSGQAADAGQNAPPAAVDVDAAVLLLGAGVTAATHPLLYVKLLIQVGHEPLPPTVGRTMFGRKVFYLPGFFSYAQHIVKVDGTLGLFRGLSPRILSSAISTVVRSKVKQVRCRTSHEMIIQCLSRIATHPFHGMSSSIPFKLQNCLLSVLGGSSYLPEQCLCVCRGFIPHVLGEVLFLWCCNLLAHFINTYAVDESFSQASAVRSYTKFVMGIAVSVLTYPFMLVADLMAINDCGLAVGLPPSFPVFKSWLHCWNHLSHKGHLFRGSSFFFRRVPVTSVPSIED
uniref:Mitochondrial carrier 1 n=1 Tax=Stegastes partitus TaxID=144197 RepID=A0A3B5B5E6_9TELE